MVSVMAELKALTIGYDEAALTTRGKIRLVSMSAHGVSHERIRFEGALNLTQLLAVGNLAIGVRPCDGIDKSNVYCCDDGSTGVGSFACCSNKSSTFNYNNITSLPTIIATIPLHSVTTASSSTATSSSTPTQSASGTCAVTFQELKTTSWGQTVKIVGNVTSLGNWDTGKAVTLDTSSYTSSNPLWKATVNLPAGQTVLYKYILIDTDGSITWEADPSRSYSVAQSCANSTNANVIPIDSWNSYENSPAPAGPSGTSPGKSSNQTALGVGLGVGLPATAAIIGGIWFMIWRSRQKQSVAEVGPQQAPPNYSVAPGDSALKPPMSQGPQVQSVIPNPRELPSGYEAGELPA
ncbi:carbohydrate-binding module family 20 protein [Hypoxylon sp. FL1857]|nr:carbohydrate-binding module family 20 protein [Hypoxylon sp. FL1857]